MLMRLSLEPTGICGPTQSQSRSVREPRRDGRGRSRSRQRPRSKGDRSGLDAVRCARFCARAERPPYAGCQMTSPCSVQSSRRLVDAWERRSDVSVAFTIVFLFVRGPIGVLVLFWRRAGCSAIKGEDPLLRCRTVQNPRLRVFCREYQGDSLERVCRSEGATVEGRGEPVKRMSASSRRQQPPSSVHSLQCIAFLSREES